MIQIVIDNKTAALKEGTAFDFVSENPLFSGSEGYTLSISLPLRGCPQNMEIFGHINRADVTASRVLLDGSISSGSLHRFGTFAITEISDAEVKVQFLEGKSEQNYDATFDKVFINELKLGEGSFRKFSDISPEDAWRPQFYDADRKLPRDVCLPWILKRGDNYNEKIGNIPYYGDTDTDNPEWQPGWRWAYEIAAPETGLACQPYLLFITKSICDALRYSCDFSDWENEESLKYLLICNTLNPKYGLRDFARALPHWSVDEYFHNLELFMGGDFAINHKEKTVKFRYWKKALDEAGKIELADVIDEHRVSVSVDDSKCDYLGVKKIKYEENGEKNWHIYDCPGFVDNYKAYFSNSPEADRKGRTPVIEYNYFYDMLRELEHLRKISCDSSNLNTYLSHREAPIDAIHYVRELDQYFIFNEYYRHEGGNHITQFFELLPLNIWGGRRLDEEADDTEKLQFVPAIIARLHPEVEKPTSQAKILYLEHKPLDEDGERIARGFKFNEDLATYHAKPWPVQALDQQPEDGEDFQLPVYYDKIFIGWYNGPNPCRDREDWYNHQKDPEWPAYYLPYPNVSEYVISEGWDHREVLPFSLRLNSDAWLQRTGMRRIDPRTKATFSFLSASIPNPRAIFYIRGKRYLCEKITATFTENGMSQLLKGEFYPLLDD